MVAVSAAGIAFTVGALLPLVLVPLLRRFGVVDSPNHRSSHQKVTVRGGGIAPMVAMLVAVVCASPHASDSAVLWNIVAGAFGAAALGFIEDFRGLSIELRLAGQVFVAAVPTVAIMQRFDLSPVVIALGVVGTIGAINVANFMDGLNAMSSIHGVLIGITYAILGGAAEVEWLSIVGASVAGAFGAFLVWNVRGQVFLGDVGSYLLGSVVALSVVAGAASDISVIALVAPAAIYLTDTTLTLLVRIIRKERWTDSHRDHIYQRLHRRGLSHLQVSGTVTAASLGCAVAGYGVAHGNGGITWVSSFAFTAIVLGYSALRLLNPQVGTAGPPTPESDAASHRGAST